MRQRREVFFPVFMRKFHAIKRQVAFDILADRLHSMKWCVHGVLYVERQLIFGACIPACHWFLMRCTFSRWAGKIVRSSRIFGFVSATKGLCSAQPDSAHVLYCSQPDKRLSCFWMRLQPRHVVILVNFLLLLNFVHYLPFSSAASTVGLVGFCALLLSSA